MSDYFRPLSRGVLGAGSDPGPIVAYDFETTLIPDGDGWVSPRFVTMYGEGILGAVIDEAQRVDTYPEIERWFAGVFDRLAPRTRLVAWNGNRFDARILMEALVRYGKRWTLRPFLAKNNVIRGVYVRRGKKGIYVLDGMAMLGLACNLKKLCAVFAPDYQKHDIGIAGGVEFNADDPTHVEYARRDARGLYEAMTNAERTVYALTKQPLRMTIGALGIRAWADALPRGVKIFGAGRERDEEIRSRCFRGGYVVTMRTYKGKAWTYDINQAYAHAMRRAWLPCGSMARTQREVRGKVGMYVGTLSRSPRSMIPYPVRSYDDERARSVETLGEPIRCMLADVEIACLRRHGWTFEVQRGYVWEGKFHQRYFVDRLERLRSQHEKDTPINVLCKAIGCNAYGKTVERETAGEYIFSAKQPKNALPVPSDEYDFDDLLWFRPTKKDGRRAYHRPQIGAVITAYVRAQLFDAIMTDPAHFLKADTDSVTFSRPNPALPLHAWKYGCWKLDSNGDPHIIIAKKVYWTPYKTTAKGLHVRELTQEDFERWEQGEAPVQRQVQLQSWTDGLAPAWKERRRSGTRVKAKAS